MAPKVAFAKQKQLAQKTVGSRDHCTSRVCSGLVDDRRRRGNRGQREKKIAVPATAPMRTVGDFMQIIPTGAGRRVKNLFCFHDTSADVR